jgi:hypothetical protein
MLLPTNIAVIKLRRLEQLIPTEGCEKVVLHA